MLPVATLGARQIYEKESIGLIGGRRAHSASDLLRRDDCVRHVPIGTSTTESIPSGTVTETGIMDERSEGKETQVAKLLERAMGFEPTTTSLGS